MKVRQRSRYVPICNVQQTVIRHENACKRECSGAFLFERDAHGWLHREVILKQERGGWRWKWESSWTQSQEGAKEVPEKSKNPPSYLQQWVWVGRNAGWRCGDQLLFFSFPKGRKHPGFSFTLTMPSAGAGMKQDSINVHWVETRSKWMWKAMIRNLDVIWQTMGSRRSLLLRGMTCSEVHFREIGLAACGGMEPKREKLEARILQESTRSNCTQGWAVGMAMRKQLQALEFNET